MSEPNPFDVIRAEVAELLGYDLDEKRLTVHQKTRLDLAAARRFDIVADIEKLKVGAVVDPEKMSQRAALFERLVPMAAASDQNAPGTKRARQVLMGQLMARIEAGQRQDAETLGIPFEKFDVKAIYALAQQAATYRDERDRALARISELEAKLATARAGVVTVPHPAATNETPQPDSREDQKNANPWGRPNMRDIREIDRAAHEDNWLDRINRRAW